MPPELVSAVIVALLSGGAVTAVINLLPSRRKSRIDEFTAIENARKDEIARIQKRLDDADEDIAKLRKDVDEQAGRYRSAVRYLNQILGLLRREAPHIELPAAPAAIAEDLL